jgi:hypothetical protein
MAAVLLPGIVSRNPFLQGMQAIALVIVMIITVSYIAQPIG